LHQGSPVGEGVPVCADANVIVSPGAATPGVGPFTHKHQPDNAHRGGTTPSDPLTAAPSASRSAGFHGLPNPKARHFSLDHLPPLGPATSVKTAETDAEKDATRPAVGENGTYD